MIHISVQTEDFNIQQEYDELCMANAQDGAVVFFVGRVRDINQGDDVFSMTLEHYPGMTEKSLQTIVEQAKERWPLNRVRIIHRVGELLPADQIVFVAAASPHREAAFSGAQFIMDYLKTEAPFWKKESVPEGERWVEHKESDQQQADKWRS